MFINWLELGFFTFENNSLFTNKYEFKKAGVRKFYEENYVNQKLQKRLRELVFSHGLTELELCKNIGLDYGTWISVKRGVRRPSHNLMIELAKVLGDEVIILFLGCYVEEEMPLFVSADRLENDPIIKKMQEKVRKVKEKGGDFRYL